MDRFLYPSRNHFRKHPMNICNSEHEEVCFDGRKCPVCEIIRDKDREISYLGDTIENLNSTIREME